MPFEPESDDRKTAAYLGLPPDQRFDFRTPWPADSLPGGQGYMLAHWGIRADWDVAMDSEPPWPFASGRNVISGQVDVFQLWMIQVYRPGYPLAAERRWHPELGIRDAIVGLHVRHTQADVLAAHRGQRLIMAQPHYAGGRRRLEKSPTSPWRPYAEQARDLLAEGEVTTIKDAAVRLGMPAYDEDRPDLDGRAERTAAARLSRYLQRLKQSGSEIE